MKKLLYFHTLQISLSILFLLTITACKKNNPSVIHIPAKTLITKKPLSTIQNAPKVEKKPVELLAKPKTKKEIHTHNAAAQANAPKFIVPIVIDQCAYHYFTRFSDYFQHGFKRFLDRGIVFTNAHHPHAAPVTATGHATLSTGVYPSQHGIIMNSWYSPEGKLVTSVDDDREEAHVHTIKGPGSDKASSRTMMTPSISDIAIQASTKDCSYHSYGISFKDRAAIGMAGHYGKAIWFDEHQQAFTSNFDYFPEKLPKWVTDFNKLLPNKIPHCRQWRLFHKLDHEVYTHYAKEIYHLSTSPITIAGKELPGGGNWKKLKATNNFMLAPQSSTMLFDLAFNCMDEIAKGGANDRGLVWVSLSSLDKVGHMYGPHSIETIDTLMHLDKIIGDFINTAEQRYGVGNVLFMLTADHGVSPIPENLLEENYKPAKRIVMHKEVDKLNKKIKEQFNIDKLFFGFKTNQLFWNEKKLTNISADERSHLIYFVKKELKKVAGIKKIWTFDELAAANPLEGSIEHLFKNQIYKGRSGYFFILGQPYVMLTNFNLGSCHRTPYNYDTHIPLMLLCPGKLKQYTIRNKVFTTQVASTIAAIWNITPHKGMKGKPLPKASCNN
jgi:predicted AlkP superfamily pyrophosphatase or phosphodiesterase